MNSRLGVKLVVIVIALWGTVFLGFLILQADIIHLNRQIYIFLRQDNFQQCQLPNYAPFDSSVVPFLKSAPPIDCSYPQLPFTHVDRNGIIYVNEAAVQKLKTLNLSVDGIQCYYYNIDRVINVTGVNDDKVKLGDPKEIISGMKIKEDYIWVECETIPDEFPVYEMGHAIIQPKPTPKKKQRREGMVNVFMMIFDATSRLNFIRQMPESYKVLTTDLNATFMRGLNKVAANTYPNMLAMLSGHADIKMKTQAGEDFSPYWNSTSTFFDDLPIVWKNFSDNGYTTLFSEDLSIRNIFNYLASGFKKPPTDYYMRPFWLAIDTKVHKFISKDSRCYAHVPKHTFLLNISRDFALRMSQENKPYFALSFMTSITHDNLNELQVLDEDFSTFLKDMLKSGAFANTLVMILGDHGNRFDQFRKTKLGSIEDNMPLLAISLPESLKKFKQNLKENSRILTSWYDVHEFLLDIATANYLQRGASNFTHRFGTRGLSLLQSIPSDRSCHEIGIPWEYCVCNSETEINPQGEQGQIAAKFLLEHVNSLIVNSPDTNCSKCAVLVLNHTLSAFSITERNSNKRYLHREQDAEYLRVTISVLPSGGHLEGSLKKIADKNWFVLGDVNRVNKYGNQSSCVKDKKLQLYCFCEDGL